MERAGNERIEDNGVVVGSLSGLYVYPVKSLGGIAVERWPVAANGLLYDRRWMVVDQGGDQLTQRELPRMSLIRPSLSAPPAAGRGAATGTLTLSAPGSGSVAVAVDRPGEPTTVRVWDDAVLATTGPAEVDAWLSEFLEVDARLVRFREAKEVDGRPWQRVAFPDSLPFLLVTQGSLDDLNRRLQERGRPAVAMNRFRPNLVVAGTAPFAEDGWLSVAVGELRLEVVKACGRCVITTVEQETAAVGREPLATLARYRTSGGKVMFGQKLIHEAQGALAVGDAVRLTEALPESRRLRFQDPAKRRSRPA